MALEGAFVIDAVAHALDSSPESRDGIEPVRVGDQPPLPLEVAVHDTLRVSVFVHGGYAFLDETAMQVARFENVYINLEVTAQLLPNHPAKFATIVGEFMAAGGTQRIFWGTGCSFTHPRPLLEAFARFEMPHDMVEGYGYPELTDDAKADILGRNFARVHGLDVDELAAAVQGDDIDERKANGFKEPWSKL